MCQMIPFHGFVFLNCWLIFFKGSSKLSDEGGTPASLYSSLLHPGGGLAGWHCLLGAAADR
jgi:hypothetical protein